MSVQAGDRIRLDHMGADPDPIPAGTTGTVRRVRPDLYGGGEQISVRWDNGRSLLLVTPPDRFTIIDHARGEA